MCVFNNDTALLLYPFIFYADFNFLLFNFFYSFTLLLFYS